MLIQAGCFNFWVYPQIALNSIIFRVLSLVDYHISKEFKRGASLQGMRVEGRLKNFSEKMGYTLIFHVKKNTAGYFFTTDVCDVIIIFCRIKIERCSFNFFQVC